MRRAVRGLDGNVGGGGGRGSVSLLIGRWPRPIRRGHPAPPWRAIVFTLVCIRLEKKKGETKLRKKNKIKNKIKKEMAEVIRAKKKDHWVKKKELRNPAERTRAQQKKEETKEERDAFEREGTVSLAVPYRISLAAI